MYNITYKNVIYTFKTSEFINNSIFRTNSLKTELTHIRKRD